MAFTADFSVTQNSEGTITLEDTSTGSDATITSRTISLFKYDGSLLNSTTYDWPIADTSITLTDVLDKDYALNIQVDWNAPSPDPANTYTVTKLYCFYWYAMLFLVSLASEKQARYNTISADSNFMLNKFKVYTFILDAQNAVSLASNIFLAQMSLDEAYNYRINQSLYF